MSAVPVSLGVQRTKTERRPIVAIDPEGDIDWAENPAIERVFRRCAIVCSQPAAPNPIQAHLGLTQGPVGRRVAGRIVR